MKKILFTGFMASILTIAGAYATDGTELTTKSYVDGAAVWARDTGVAAANAVQANLTTHTTNTDIHVTAGQKTAWTAKQDAITDLDTIRSGAYAGATAVQPTSLAPVATSGNYNDLSNKPTIPSVEGLATSESVTALTSRVTTAEGEIDALQTAVGDANSGLVKTVADHGEYITTLGTTKAENSAVTALDTRVGALEATVGDETEGLVKDVADNTSAIDGLDTSITTLQGTVANKADASTVSTLQTTVADQGTAISSLQTSVASKADSANVYTKTEVYTKGEVDDLIEGLNTISVWDADDIYTPSSQSGGQN